MSSLPTHAVIREVGLRDGLQSISTILPTAVKCEWIRLAHAAGLTEIEVGSFVPPSLLPQMADTAEVVAFAKTLPGLSVTALIPNVIGAQRAMDTGVHHIVLPISASAAHSQANVRRSPDTMIRILRSIVAERDARQSPVRIEAGLGTAFGCGLQGRVAPADVLRLMREALDAGADCTSLADTIGYADPASVRTLFTEAREVAGERLWCGHFHDTRGLALANVFAALECGVTRFDASLAGIGGCPFAPGASGNVATEDLAYMLASMGIQTGVDVPAVLRLRALIAGHLRDETLHGTVHRAGLPLTFPATAPATAPITAH
ncbi:MULTISPECIES: hydroxymethylglutaryl-CoA lyase [Paraburkholderia]|uniref:Hydroxymethylglutaryl-CoA lyase n=1 Tax=Paraburkholderia dipogonis TaxID=1211383 RepID=A0A4Y8MGQ2_9BURK|nr:MULTISPECIES: hydroxymethylglutaryl-CoA lyase [Paraburkholderia]RKR31374.1 hydroxymethylglutaryl-CoA lyase [Paraburkholderia sp. BL17N1]TFE36666.1 hydroxymethylglutaryl-CoA lyase [Paraburkholderia dipogonis]